MAKAPVILWPAGQVAYKAYRGKSYNVQATKMKTTKEIFAAGKRNVILHLPYAPGTGLYASILQ